MEDFFSQDLVANLLKFKIPIALTIIGIFFISLGLISPSLNQSGKKSIVVEKSSAVSNQQKLKVDVSGAIKNPGVYELTAEDRVVDAITLAGGFNQNVDQGWVDKNLNLAAKLTDGQKIYIASINDQANANVLSSQTSSQTAFINVNTASAAELDTLPGIGTVTANKIIASRPYQKIEELLDRKVVNSSTFNKIKDLVSVY